MTEAPAALTVVRCGPLTTVQDAGRPGYAHLGVPPSGAVDTDSHGLANRLVGNRESAASLEATFGGLAVELSVGRWVALAGAPVPATVDGQPVALYAPIYLDAGQRLALGRPPLGVRTYLAVAGGVAARLALGSRSTDLLSGLGPAPLTAGARIPLGEPAGPPSTVDFAPWSMPEPVTLRLHPGPRADWFTDDAFDAMTAQPYRVTADSNRIGIRLDGPVPRRRHRAELPSEGLVTGALQVPGSGQPVLFLADHPTTGGYPVIGVVDPADLPLAAQARPGTLIRFEFRGNRARGGISWADAR